MLPLCVQEGALTALASVADCAQVGGCMCMWWQGCALLGVQRVYGALLAFEASAGLCSLKGGSWGHSRGMQAGRALRGAQQAAHALTMRCARVSHHACMHDVTICLPCMHA